MKTGRNILILALGFILASCSQNSLVSEPIQQSVSFRFDASLTDSKSSDSQKADWKSGVKAGLFTSENKNIAFTNSVNGENALFSGNLSGNTDNEYIYVAYPYNSSSSLDADHNYTFSIPTEQIQNTYVSDLSAYDYMIGCSTTKVNSDEDFSSVKFQKMMSRMDFVVGNETGSDIKVNRVTMTSHAGENLFATSATVKMDPSTMSLDNYRVSPASEKALSVKIQNPTEISNGRSEVISITFFPIGMTGGTELEFTVETSKGNFSIVKTIGGLGTLNFTRGGSYITPITIN